MADITMCKGYGCPLKNKCYRYTAYPSFITQSYFLVEPYKKDKNKCSEFWENNKK